MQSSSDSVGLWNISAAARYLGMSVAFIRKAVRKNAIPYIRVGDKSLRFSKPNLDEWLATRTMKGAQ